MKYVSFIQDGIEQAGIQVEQGVISIEMMNRIYKTDWSTDMMSLLREERLDELNSWIMSRSFINELPGLEMASPDEIYFAPLYRNPGKIYGIGFNYTSSYEELTAFRNQKEREEPVGFFKPSTSLIGPGDDIRLPEQSERVIAEAELAIVIGKACSHVSEEIAAGCIAGYVAVLDIGADDIHQKNPRFLTRSKSFDTFFSLGSELLTPDEVDPFAEIQIATIRNGQVEAQKKAGLMRYTPAHVVSFHSEHMTLLPGDIIMTGTPGACIIREGDHVECRIDGFMPLVNGVSRTIKRTDA
ncbi:fumarylacetoacetate hydrolase family protein [Paenibacillus urinalis]|uniref:Fumarylacetoacetate hydrolase family protein n=1 Tax=Paenibacillus urinalis TaxID=521520 RepID=A0AAX3MUT9_9BACL|nr:fumarylacetoacetate hydrolase family protein [Paenibacillus urinalis]WDH81393.1 fumarylacetoacetate hydrolase family protein [Paenibacillus urinalis]